MSKRHRNSLARRKPRREPYAKVLIVCEGAKTEPNYFNGLKDHYELNSANVEITGESGSSPAGIVKYAKQRYRKEKEAGDPFDKVYCVFDQDHHETYKQALETIADAKPKAVFYATTSVPCFEYWLLLHFEYTTKPYHGERTNSPCRQVLDDLKKHIPRYEKGARNLFDELRERLEHAKTNAPRSLDAAYRAGTDNPSTKAHELVDFLQKIKANAKT